MRRLRERHSVLASPLGADYENKARELDQTAEVLRSMLAGAEI